MKLTAVEKLLIRSPLRAYMLQRLEAPRVLSHLDIGERSVCLDIGCGSGMGALLINQYLDCEKVVGIDVDPDYGHRSRGIRLTSTKVGSEHKN